MYLEKYYLKKCLYMEYCEEVLVVFLGCEDGLFEVLELFKEILIWWYFIMFRFYDDYIIENFVMGDVWDF